MNIDNAYPPEAQLENWRRTVRLDRKKNEVEVRDAYVLKKPVPVITLSLMTPCAVEQTAPGELKLSGATAGFGSARVLFDGSSLKPVVEDIPLNDGRLSREWGPHMHRILLRAEQPPARGTWVLRVV